MTADTEPEPAEEQVGGRVAGKSRQLLKRGSAAVKRLPSPEQLADRSDAARHELLEGLRVELYAVASVLAEAAVGRAYDNREEHPPYGLVRSGHTEWRLVLATPKPVEAGDLDSFTTLGKAYVDTVVFHLHQLFEEAHGSKVGWMVERLEALLALFRVGAAPATKARMRDGLSFVYGGLHFGTGVSVQLAEVMTRLLAAYDGLDPAGRAAVMARSSRPALRMAALNLDHVIVAYHELLASGAGQRWFRDEVFLVEEDSAGAPLSIDFRPDLLLRGKPHVPQLDSVRTTWDTHGCPARISPAGVTPPIARLWAWGVQLSLEAGLLGG